MSEPLTEEEKQKIRVELMAEMVNSEQDPEQCNEETGRYNREFLYNVRDLEQLCSITECALTPHQIKEYGICRSQLRKKRVMEMPKKRAELMAETTKNEQDLEQCNEQIGRYNREYLYNVRDLEQLCTLTQCPLTSQQLKEFGIWRLIPGNHTDKAWDWRRADRILINRFEIAKKELDLEQCNMEIGRYNREFFYNVRDLEKLYPTKCPVKCAELKKFEIYCNEMQENYNPKRRTGDATGELHKAECPWKLDKIYDNSDDAKKKFLIRQVRALLNKITTTTEKELTQDFLGYKVYQSSALREIVSIVVDFALEEPFCELFTRLCHRQITDERANSKDNHSTFHDAILYSLQVAMDFGNQKETETDANKRIDSLKNLKRRWFGSVKFIDQLYLIGLISMRMDFVDDLLRSVIINSAEAPDKPDEASIEGSLIILGTIGHRLQYANEAKAEATVEPFPLDRLFYALQRVKPFVSSRIRFMIEDVVDQRANGWTPMKTVREEARIAEAEKPKPPRYPLQKRNLGPSRWELFRMKPESADGWEKGIVQHASISETPVNQRKPLHKADRPWKLEKLNDDSEDAKMEFLIRQVHALLNKITPTTEESLTDQFLEYKVYETSALREIITIIVNLAQNEPRYSKLLSRMCRAQFVAELEAERDQQSVFQYALSAHVEQTFPLSTVHLLDNEDAETGEKKRIDSLELLNELRSRRFGCAEFIVHLSLYGVIKFQIPSSFAVSLLSSVAEKADDSAEPDEESIECAVHLLRSAGYRLHKDSGLEPGYPATVSTPFPFDWAFTVLQRATPVVSNRIRFMIMDLEEQRLNGWKARESTRKGPEPIDETKKERKTKKSDKKDAKSEHIENRPNFTRYTIKNDSDQASKSLNWRLQ